MDGSSGGDRGGAGKGRGKQGGQREEENDESAASCHDHSIGYSVARFTLVIVSDAGYSDEV